MFKQTKIRYHYDFPNLPITDNDIQALYEKMNDILWTAENYIYKLNYPKMHLPKIFISDDIVTKTYGKYDYKAILKEIKKFNEKFSYSYYCEILVQLENTIKRIEDGANLESLKELIDYLVSKIDHAENSEVRQAITRIIAMLKNTKRIINTLGTYNHQNNKITLYINSIVDYFSKAPGKDLSTQIKTGLEIVLAHEVFHAIQYHLIIFDNKKAGKSIWEYTSGHKDYRSTVLEGLARWFEYVWCKENINTSKVYQWHIEQIKKEVLSNSEHNYPYATAADILLNNGEFMEDIYINGEAISTLYHNIKRKDKIYWNEIYYQ